MNGQRTEMSKMSAKKRRELALQGIDNPMSTFRPTVAKATSRKPAKRATDTGPDAPTVDLVLDRDQHSCVLCGGGVGDRRGTDYSIHHRLLRSQGVNNSPSNLITLCGSGTTECHGAVHAKPKWARSFGGWLLRSTDNPAVYPVLIERASRWVLLTNNGYYVTTAAPSDVAA